MPGLFKAQHAVQCLTWLSLGRQGGPCFPALMPGLGMVLLVLGFPMGVTSRGVD